MQFSLAALFSEIATLKDGGDLKTSLAVYDNEDAATKFCTEGPYGMSMERIINCTNSIYLQVLEFTLIWTPYLTKT